MENKDKRYSWKRYWCKRDGRIFYDESGYVVDPQNIFLHNFQTDLVPFEEIDHYPCLILLGEPGIGKSAEISNINKGLKFDLNQYGSEDRLINDIFKSDEFIKFINCSNELYLVLDSLDECKIAIPTISQIILSQLKQNKDIIKENRLKLRIACRTADWNESLENGLKELYGENGVGIFELAPLTESAVKEAVKSEGIDNELFMEEIDKKQVASLAIKPITFIFLINIFKKDHRFASTQFEIYRRGCEKLCEELNPTRIGKNSQYTGKLTPSQRMHIASRIAAVMMFCNKTAIFKSSDIGRMGDNEIKMYDLCKGYEKIDGVKLDVNKDYIDETLKTGLFSSRGPNRLGFAHQTYAEFLAAYYLNVNSIDKEQIMRLIQHNIDDEKKIIPQLSNIASWIASMNEDIFKEIIHIDPQVILKSDVSSYSNEIKKEWISTLLNMMEERKISDTDRSIRRQYLKMNHPEIEEQLKPYISDSSKYYMTRRVAIDIAESCNLKSLQNLLADITLDESEDYFIRGVAARSVKNIADDKCKLRLKPLAIEDNPNDTDDQLKGYAMIALWPNQISAKEVFDNLTYPKKPNYCGSYSSFQYSHLIEHLNTEDLPIALNWTLQNIKNINKNRYKYDLGSVNNHLIYMGWQNTEHSKILESLVDVILECFKNNLGIYGIQKGDYENRKIIVPPDDIRHRVIEKIIPKIIGIEHWETRLTWATFGDPLILMDDIPWLIEVLKNEKNDQLKSSLAKIIGNMIIYQNIFDKYFDNVYKSAQSCPELYKEIEIYCKAVTIDSQQYVNGKERYEKNKQIIKSRETETTNAPVNERIISCLNRFENGDLDAWWHLCYELLFSDQHKEYGNVFQLDITSLPSWQSIDSETKTRIIDSAQVYIIKQKPEIDKWISENKIYHPDHSGYKALFLLFKEKQDFLKNMEKRLWEKWAPVILAIPEYYGSKDHEPHLDLISLAYKNAPKPFTDTLLILIAKENKSQQLLSCIGKIKKCWDENLCNSLVPIATDDSLTPINQGQLLGELIRNGCVESEKYAKSLLFVPLPRNKVKRERSLNSAIVLIKNIPDAGWEVVWHLIKRYKSFGNKIISIIVDSLDHPYEKSFITKLNENQISDLYIWLEKKYPHSEDPNILEFHAVSIREKISHFRRSVINHLTECGTIDSIKAIEKISQKLPHLEFVKNVLIETKNNTIQEIWTPPTIDQFLDSIKKPGSIIVTNADNLLESVIETLRKMEREFHGENPAVYDVWNEVKNVFTPKDEVSFSSYITRYLKNKLKETAVFVKPEVQIRRGIGKGPNRKKGQRTDIYLEAAIPGIDPDTYEKVKLIIEVKGCWNPKLMTEMKSQLVDRYLKNNDCKYGLYMVGWFNCHLWDSSDPRMQQSKNIKLLDLKKELEEQAKSLSNQERTIRSHVIDCGLHF